MASFATIRARAESRKGGAAALKALLPAVPPKAALANLRDARALAEMARRVFSSGFSWSVIKAKWPGFEEVFLGFEAKRLAFEPDDFWDRLVRDERIVRNGAKIQSVRANARFICDIAKEHGSFGKFLAGWPSSDEIGLLALLVKRGARLGGLTGQMLLRALEWDGFVLSQDVVLSLKDAGLDIAPEPKSKGDLAKIQAQFNAWAEETGLSYTHLSRILAMSIGENYGERDRVGLTYDAD